MSGPVPEVASQPSTTIIYEMTANLLMEVCHDIRTEPDLQPLTGEVVGSQSVNTSDGAHLDIAVNGFWSGRYGLGI